MDERAATEWARAGQAGLTDSSAVRELSAMLDGLGAWMVADDVDRQWVVGVGEPVWHAIPLDDTSFEPVEGADTEIVGADGASLGRLRTAEPGIADLVRAAPRLELWLDRLRERTILNEVSSELIRDHRLLRTRLVDLEEHSDRLQRFAYGVAHELGRPLATMAVTVEAMRISLPEATPLAEVLTNRIGGEVDHLQRLVTMLMDVAAVASSAAESDIRDIVDDVERPLPKRSIRWNIDESVELVPASCSMILVNLAENAVKYGDANPNTPVEISVWNEDGWLYLLVADRGPGLGTDVEPGQPFEMFWSSKGGTGVGLAVVDQLVRDGGGSIETAERDGGGLEVRCQLPQRR